MNVEKRKCKKCKSEFDAYDISWTLCISCYGAWLIMRKRGGVKAPAHEDMKALAIREDFKNKASVEEAPY